jgi:uncharacterized RDD family membrane protein YckC
MSGNIKLSSADGLNLELEIAALGSRSYAFIIDWHFRTLLALAWLLAAWLLMSGSEDISILNIAADTEGKWRMVMFFLPPLLIYLLYHPVLESSMGGRTPGKRFAGLRLVTLNGNTPSFSAILIRNLFRLVDSLPMLYVLGCASCIFSQQKRRIGDMAAGTLLVYEETVSKKELRNSHTLALNSDLTPENQTLLLDILTRWKTLNQSSRIKIGRAFLLKNNQSFPPQAKIPEEELAIYDKLITLAGSDNYEQ